MLFVLAMSGMLTINEGWGDQMDACVMVAKEFAKRPEVSTAFCLGTDDDGNSVVKR